MINKSLRLIDRSFLWKMYSKNYTFTQSYNPLTGSNEWYPKPADYDYIQEISRSGYGDMLWDQERNQLYYKAILKVVKKLLQIKPSHEKLNVIDIGTGTGLLSMMICKSFGLNLERLSLTAFECFKPVADCAKKVITKNGYEDYIQIVNCRSNEISFANNNKADLLVTEVFDTELIGEGALGVFNWALNHQLKGDAFIIPSKARIWIQLITSSWLSNGYQFNLDSSNLTVPTTMLNCLGSNHLHDLQANQFIVNQDIYLLTDPKVIFSFDFNDSKSLKYFDHQNVEFVLNSSVNDENIMILFWWDLFMDSEEEYLLTCSPYWARGFFDQHFTSWRDHWMQAIYYLPANLKSFKLTKGSRIQIDCYHDEYSFWFNHRPSSIKSTLTLNSVNFCSCGQHLNRNRLRIINDHYKLSLYYQKLVSLLNSKKSQLKICFLGDASLIPIKIAKEMTNCDKIFVLTKGLRFNQNFYQEFGKANNCDKKIIQIDNFDQLPEDIILDAVIAEPYFNNINLPWDTLHYWYLLTLLKQTNHFDSQTMIMPESGSLKALPVSFENLWKIRAKVGSNVEGFDLTDFDDMLDKAMNISDALIESQPLWEYPCFALTDQPIDLFDWNFAKTSISKDSIFSVSKFIKIKNNSKLTNICLAFWIEYEWNGEKWSTGLLESRLNKSRVKWNREWKQGVAFLYPLLDQSFKSNVNISLNVKFIASSGLLQLDHYLTNNTKSQV